MSTSEELELRGLEEGLETGPMEDDHNVADGVNKRQENLKLSQNRYINTVRDDRKLEETLENKYMMHWM